MYVLQVRLWFLRCGITLLLLAPFFIDWTAARARLPQIGIDSSLNRPSVVADGKNSIVITLRVTEGNKPRANDLLQSWIEVGGGLLKPQWAYTDEDGVAKITFSPNPATPYDSQGKATIRVANVSVGRLIEVRKLVAVDIPLELPSQEEEGPTNLLGF